MKTNRQSTGVSLERAKQIIVNSDSMLTKEIVDSYTVTEIKEWMKQLKIKTNF